MLDDRLQKSGDSAEIADVQVKKDAIYELVTDTVLANALAIDVLVDSPAVEADSRIVGINHGLRWAYLGDIQPPDFTLPAGMFTKGIQPTLADELENEGVVGIRADERRWRGLY